MIAVCKCVAEAPPAEAGEAEAEYPAAWHALEALEADWLEKSTELESKTTPP